MRDRNKKLYYAGSEVYILHLQFYYESDNTVISFHSFYASFVTFCYGLCNGQSYAESGVCCPGGILTVKAVKQTVQLYVVHVLAAVCDCECRVLLLAQYSFYTAALIAVFYCVVK